MASTGDLSAALQTVSGSRKKAWIEGSGAINVTLATIPETYCYDSMAHGNVSGEDHYQTLLLRQAGGTLPGTFSFKIDDSSLILTLRFVLESQGQGNADYQVAAGAGSLSTTVITPGENEEGTPTTTAQVINGRFAVHQKEGKGKKDAPGGSVICYPVNFAFEAVG